MREIRVSVLFRIGNQMSILIYGCFLRVRWSARVKMPSTGIATLPWTILYMRASRASPRLWTRGIHPSWFKDVGDAGSVVKLLFHVTMISCFQNVKKI